MGTAVAGVLVKGFKEGAKANQDAVAGQDNESQAKTKTDNPSDAKQKRPTEKRKPIKIGYFSQTLKQVT